jgi:CRP-like cAMP-binding protein
VTEFSKLGPEELQQMADAMATQEFADGEAIIEQDEVVDDESKFYIIESGKVSVTLKDMGEVAVLSCPACFGERAILTSEPRNATIRAQVRPTQHSLLRSVPADTQRALHLMPCVLC